MLHLNSLRTTPFLFALLSPALLPAQQDLGPVGYWKLDETSGTDIADSSGQNSNGTLTGSGSFTTGKIGGALNLSGGYVSIPGSQALSIGGNAISFGAWYYHTPSTDGYILGKTVTDYSYILGVEKSAQQFVAYLNTGGTLRILRWPSSTPGGLSPFNNTWVHLMVTYDGTQIIAYTNGLPAANLPATGPLVSNGDDFAIGARGGDGSWTHFTGIVDDVRVYARTLDPQEILSLVNGPATAPNSPVINFFTASPSSIAPGDTATLAWSVSGASSLSLDQGIGPVTSARNQAVSPTATTVYTLTASNESGSASATTTVTVKGPPALKTLTCTPAAVYAPASVTCTVSLDQTVSSTTAVPLSSTNNGALTVPSTISIPTGASSSTFAAATVASPTDQSADITASFAGATRSATVAVLAATGTLRISLSTPPNRINRYDIFELTMISRENFANPWEDPAIVATFSAPSGKTYSVGGFYYDTNNYKLRFAPPEAGPWTWSLSFSSGGKTFTSSGSLTVSPSANTGFLRIHPSNPRRFITDGANLPFYPLGFNDCVGDWTGPSGSPNGSPDGLLDWSMDALPNAATTDQYFGAFSEAGANIFRHGPGNCSDSLFDSSRFNFNGSGKNFYLAAKGKLVDQLVTKLHQTGMKYFLTLLPTPTWLVPGFDLSDPMRAQALLNYHRYLINRYGAYVDIWELMNEQSGVPAAYYNTVAGFIRSYDPYQHPITTSYFDNPVPGVTLIEINSPHIYYGVDNLSLDDQMVNGTYGFLAYKSKFPNLPLLIGESGNIRPVSNYDPERYRIGIWTALLNEAGILYWNTSFTKYPAGGSGLANMFIGPEERAFMRILANFSSGFDPLAKPVTVSVSNAAIHAYVLQSGAQINAYLVNSASHSVSTSGITVSVNVPAPGLQGQWIDPKDGTILQAFTPSPGPQSLAVPPFTCDVALRIR